MYSFPISQNSSIWNLCLININVLLKFWLIKYVVYKIPYRRAWPSVQPLGRVRA